MQFCESVGSKDFAKAIRGIDQGWLGRKGVEGGQEMGEGGEEEEERSMGPMGMEGWKLKGGIH